MHAIAREHGLRTSFICVDTWLGSSEHWLNAKDREHLRLEGGHPTLYRQFIANVVANDASDDVYPLPLTTVAAARVLEALEISADVIYVDAGHEEAEVALDLELFRGRLRRGGVLFGDDYHERWPGVVRSVDRFCKTERRRLVVDGTKWLVRL